MGHLVHACSNDIVGSFTSFKKICRFCCGRVSRETLHLLTTCSFSIATNIVLFHLFLNTCLLPHFLDLRHAKLGIEAEEHFPSSNGQIVLTPVPQILQVLVVDCRECIRPVVKKHIHKQRSIKQYISYV